jgi:hypothetical protein
MGWLCEKEKGKKETKRPTQESLGSGKGITFVGIVVIWGNAFTLFSGFFGTKLSKNTCMACEIMCLDFIGV